MRSARPSFTPAAPVAFNTHSGRSAGIRFARLASGTRIAWAASGRGPALVRVAHWMTHVEQDLQSPLWGPWLARLNQSVQLVRYDERGCGLSGADMAQLGLATALEELEAVVDAVFEATGQRQVALLGMSGAGPVAIAYAAKHPERVTRLVLHGAYGPKDAPAILGIGGWIGSGELWALPFETLSQRWRTISYDHRGSGASVAAVDSITLANLVNDVFAVLDAHGIERCVLAAESSGALTALSAALQQPERINGLVVVDGMVFRGLDSATDPFLKGLQHAYAATLDRFVDLCMPDEGPAHIKRWGRQIIDRAAPEAAIALRRVNNEADIRAALPKIQQPTLVIHCDGDKIVPVEQARMLAKILPNAELVILKDSGHIPTMTRPAEIAAQIERFFA